MQTKNLPFYHKNVSNNQRHPSNQNRFPKAKPQESKTFKPNLEIGIFNLGRSHNASVANIQMPKDQFMIMSNSNFTPNQTCELGVTKNNNSDFYLNKGDILKDTTPVSKGTPLNTKKFFGSNPGLIQTNMEHFTTEPYGDSPEELMASGEKFHIENLKTVNSQCSYAGSGSPKLEGSKFLIKNNSQNIPNSMIHKKSYKHRNAVPGVCSNLNAGHASGTNFSKKTFQTHANFGRSLLANKLSTTSLPKLLSKNFFNHQQYLDGQKDSIYEGGITGVPLMPNSGRQGNSTLSNNKNVTQPGYNESNLGKTLTENYETGTDRRNLRESCQGSLKKIEQNAYYEKLSQD
jgi:hypothetical protein